MKRRLGGMRPGTDMMKKSAFFIGLALIMGACSGFAATNQQLAPDAKEKPIQAPAQQPAAKDKAAEAQAQAQPEKIVAGPQNIKERTRIYVFVGWLWAAIVVLIYITRLEIKEADRLLDLRFYRHEKK